MIIGSHSEILHALSFVAGLNRAAQGVARVEVEYEPGRYSFSSAWLITDTLVVLPEYSLAGSQNCVVRFSTEPEKAIEADLVAGSSTSHPAMGGLRLMRLPEPVPGRAIKLKWREAVEHDRLYILHHPDGVIDLKMSIGQLLQRDDQQLLYDADTLPGSGGAPIFSDDWQLVGMHTGTTRDRRFNRGLSLGIIRNALNSTDIWRELDQIHDL